MNDAIDRVPYPPESHLTVTVRTVQGVAPGALLIALAVGQRGENLDRPRDDAFDRG